MVTKSHDRRIIINIRMFLSQQISNFIYNTNYGNLPDDVIEKAKQCLFDSIGVALYGSQFEASQISLALIKKMGGENEASILGTNQKTPCFLAALANGIRGHIADYDDSLADFGGHPSCILMPVTLALAEMRGIGGQEILTAFILGSEVGSKLGRVMGKNHYDTGFHPTGTIGTIAAVAAAAKLLELLPSQITNALGIAASSASGLRQNFGTMTKSWHAGHAASMGVMAALLAQKGFNASVKVLEGETGFIQTFQGSRELFPLGQLGNPYSLMKIQVKVYPSCAMTHPSVDAILKLKKEYCFNSQEVKAMECYICSRASSILGHKKPHNALQAKFSLEYCLVAALISGNLGINQFTDEAVSKSEVRGIMKKISIKIDPHMDELAKKKNLLSPSKIKIILNNEQEVSQTVGEAKGGPNNPLKWSELEEKFLECSHKLLSKNQVKKFCHRIRNLEEISNISDLVSLLISKNT